MFVAAVSNPFFVPVLADVAATVRKRVRDARLKGRGRCAQACTYTTEHHTHKQKDEGGKDAKQSKHHASICSDALFFCVCVCAMLLFYGPQR